jgi:hypothetical protein
MNKTAETAVAMHDEGVRHYMYLCFSSLLVMALCLSLRGLESWSLLPTLVGALVLVFRWRTGPLIVLVLVAWLLGVQRWAILHPIYLAEEIVIKLQQWLGEASGRWGRRPMTFAMPRSLLIADLALCASVLVYLAGNYRLQGLARQIFPGDPRQHQTRGSRRVRVVRPRRSAGLVKPAEIITFVATVPVWIGLAWLCWRWLSGKESPFDLDDGLWRGVLLAWLLGLLYIVGSGLLGYLAQLRMEPKEAGLFLQDTLWRETAREQRRDHRWWVWWRRRQRRKEEL